MADAAMQLLLKTLFNLTRDEIQLLFGVEEERKKLCSNFSAIQAVLKDAELNLPEKAADQDWLVKLQGAMFEIEDILDECSTHFSKADHLPARSTCCSFMSGTPFRHDIGMRMKAAATTLDLIAKQHADYRSNDSCESQPSDSDAAARETGSLLNKIEPPIGRDAEKEEIVQILVNQVTDNPGLSVLPIIGLGGLGKTTLAQLVFNDPRVVEHFQEKMWICVSDNFDVKTLMKDIIKSGDEKGSEDEKKALEDKKKALDDKTLDALQHQLCQLLIQKRYLLVLDDVWSDEMEKWCQLKNVLSCEAPGSSIIVTTRLQKVAEIMGTLPAQNLEGLTNDQCWMLLKQRAFRSDEEGKYPNLEDIGKQIAKKCAGVPLAAKVLGGLLRFQRLEKEWVHVKESEVWNLEEAKTKILPVLRLSYQHLPLYLRQCFAYCAIFAKDSQIEKEDLIHRWMAQGYISSKGSLEVEDVGEQIYNELIVRSFLQNVVDMDGEILMTKVVMHDLVHDLAQSIMESKVPTTQLGMMLESELDRKIREVNLRYGYVAFPKSTPTQMDISFILKKYNRLRVLDAQHMLINYLPSTIGSLQHLRLLNLSSCHELRTLPDSICILWNLQVLNLNWCRGLEHLSKKMRNLKNLRHLFMEGCDSLRETPPYIRELSFLRTLSLFIVGWNKGCGLEELERLNLQGSLEICHLERVENLRNVEKANLSKKHNLHQLTLRWSNASKENDMDDKVLEYLQPHSHVKELSISGFCGKHFPTWMKMSTLVEVGIHDCVHIMILSPLAEMPHLQFLSLKSLGGVEYIDHGGNETSIYFPALRVIELRSLPKLKALLKVKVGRGLCPQLEKLIGLSCPSFDLLSFLEEFLLFDQGTLENVEVLEDRSDRFLSITFVKKFLRENNPQTSNDLQKHPTNVKSFQICGNDCQCLPELIRHLPSLRILELANLCNLTLLPEWLGDLTSLEDLGITNCSELSSLPDSIQGMTNLHSLKISGCPTLASLPDSIQGMTNLRSLEIDNCRKLASLPDSIQGMTNLHSLKISGCPTLASLPDSIQGMTNLHSLEISWCQELASLPDSIQRMTSLRHLQIYRCPDLERRYGKETGEDWHKIAHIESVLFEDSN